MTKRFHISNFGDESRLSLSGTEAHHLRNVMRMQPGESLWLFDGQGTEAQAKIVAFSPEGVLLQLLERRQVKPDFQVTIAAAVPKGDRVKWMVEKMTELGVSKFIPLITAQSVVDPREGKLERLRQTVIEASKQCGRSHLMEISEPVSWEKFLQQDFSQLWIAHPGGSLPEQKDFAAVDHCTVAIGPEGGFTDREVAQAMERGARLLGLGSNILRIETAALAAAVLFALRR
ncbi:MAG: RsmE family RNA methyltransferase [Planctomycetales bacterium]